MEGNSKIPSKLLPLCVSYTKKSTNRLTYLSKTLTSPWQNTFYLLFSLFEKMHFNTSKVFSRKEIKSLIQEALNTWRGRLQLFLQLLYNQKIQKVILIWFVHLLKSNKFSEFHRCGSKNVPATPIFILNFPRAWQSF